MPWEIKNENGKYCVYKEGTDELEKCHVTKSEAEDHMKALYASENVEKHVVALEKCYYDYYGYGYGHMPTYGATSFEELDQIKAMKHLAMVFGQFLGIAENIVYYTEMDEKVEALENLMEEFKGRIGEAHSMIEKMSRDNPDDASEEVRQKTEKPDGAIEKEWVVTLSKAMADDEKQIAYGVVLEPDTYDSQGDIISAEEIEKAAHAFFAKLSDGEPMHDYQHEHDLPKDSAVPVESYIAPENFSINGQSIRKGSWILAAHIADHEIWSEIKKGSLLSYSIKGYGKREPVE